jgi:hypothetical protein
MSWVTKAPTVSLLSAMLIAGSAKNTEAAFQAAGCRPNRGWAHELVNELPPEAKKHA